MSHYNSLPPNCIEITEPEYWRLAGYDNCKPTSVGHREINVVMRGIGDEIQSFPLFARAGVPRKVLLIEFDGFTIGVILPTGLVNGPRFFKSGTPPADAFYEEHGSKGEF